MDIQIQSICWFVLGVILFIIALVTDEELRKEFKDIRYASAMIFTVIALYGAIMWIAKQWVMWCL